MVAIVVQVLHFAFVERRPLDIFLRPELVVRQRASPDVAHPCLNVSALIAGRQMMQIEDAEEIVALLDEHTLPQTCRLNR